MHRRHFLSALAAAPLLAQPKPAAKIKRIRISTLQGRFHKFVAMNAYDKAPKGYTYEHTLYRIETDQGTEGIAAGNYTNLATREHAESLKPLIGMSPFELYEMKNGRITGRAPLFAPLLSANRHLDAAFYDIIGKLNDRPAWRLIGESVKERVPAYDGTMYFSDLWFRDRGVRAVAEECEEAVKYGFTGVKIKLGRGDKWMVRNAGDDRDIDIVHAVRQAIGPRVMLMADPNYGYKGQFDAAWRLLFETRADNLYWMEEIFPETVEDYTQLKYEMNNAGMKTKLAAGEHMRDTHEFDPFLKPKRLMDVLQMDIRQGGFLDNAEVARSAAETGAVVIPHNWASQIGVIMSLHLARACKSVPMVECDRSTCDVLRTDAYALRAGMFDVPSYPGLGIEIDEDVYKAKHQPTEIIVS
jgi:L-alanine-DL-glutamate epimerase-like enolase superfamily enzyme